MYIYNMYMYADSADFADFFSILYSDVQPAECRMQKKNHLNIYICICIYILYICIYMGHVQKKSPALDKFVKKFSYLSLNFYF